MDSPGSRKPPDRQCPLDMTIAGSVGTEFGSLITEPEQLLSATVPAKLTVTAARAVCAGAASRLVADADAAPVPVSAAPLSSRAVKTPTRGRFMWGVLSRPKFFRHCHEHCRDCPMARQ